MIKYIKKDITTVEQGVIVHGCNCQGAMGSGVAKALYEKWPEVKKQYHKVFNALTKNYEKKQLLGVAHAFNVDGQYKVYVVNGFTQEYYGRDGKRYADPTAIFKVVGDAASFADHMIMDLYMPRIGCSLGGLDWDIDVRPQIEKVAEMFPNLNIYVCDL